MSADTNDFIERIPHDRAHAVKGPDAVAQPHPEAGEIYLEFMNSGNDAIFRLFPEFWSSKFTPSIWKPLELYSHLKTIPLHFAPDG